MGVSRGVEAAGVRPGAGGRIVEFGACERGMCLLSSHHQHPAIGEQRRRVVEPGSLEAAGVFPFKGSSSARLHGRKPGRKRQQQEYNRSRQKRGGCRLSYRGDELSRNFHWIVMETREHTGDFKRVVIV